MDCSVGKTASGDWNRHTIFRTTPSSAPCPAREHRYCVLAVHRSPDLPFLRYRTTPYTMAACDWQGGVGGWVRGQVRVSGYRPRRHTHTQTHGGTMPATAARNNRQGVSQNGPDTERMRARKGERKKRERVRERENDGRKMVHVLYNNISVVWIAFNVGIEKVQYHKR